jgi:hypothetical protein
MSCNCTATTRVHSCSCVASLQHCDLRLLLFLCYYCSRHSLARLATAASVPSAHAPARTFSARSAAASTMSARAMSVLLSSRSYSRVSRHGRTVQCKET